MSLLSENVIPGNHGKIFATNAKELKDLNNIKSQILTIDGVKEVTINMALFPREFTVYTTKLIKVDTVEDKVNRTGFHAIPKDLFSL
jgi:copper chaperone CopZ